MTFPSWREVNKSKEKRRERAPKNAYISTSQRSKNVPFLFPTITLPRNEEFKEFCDKSSAKEGFFHFTLQSQKQFKQTFCFTLQQNKIGRHNL